MAQTISSMAEDRDNCRKMGLAGRNYLERNFSRAVIAGNLLKLMEAMAN
jgi:glycosyltransferase involved in cell wall biosynthesis